MGKRLEAALDELRAAVFEAYAALAEEGAKTGTEQQRRESALQFIDEIAQTRVVSLAGILARILGIRASSAGVARASIPAEILAYARAAYPQRRSSNANSLQSQKSAGFRQICAIFQRDNLRRHF